MLDRLGDLIRGAGQPRESDSARDGFLSYAAEVHAVGHGLYAGLTSRPWRFRPTTLPDNPDVQAEPHYFKGAYVLGTVIQWVILVTVSQETAVAFA